MEKRVKYRFLEFFVFDYDSLPNLLFFFFLLGVGGGGGLLFL